MLEIALLCRNFGVRPSGFLQIDCDLAAVNFDRAANYRLVKYDNERETNRRKDEANLFYEAMLSVQLGQTFEFESETKDDDLEEMLSKIPGYN